MSMLDEHDFTEEPSVAVENSYYYADRTVLLRRDTWHDSKPAGLFRYRVIKRCLDLSLVLIALPVLLPLLILIAIAVTCSSRGPVFFSHRRIRKHGAFFSMWKFRTMCVNSTEVLEEHLRANPVARAEWSATRKLRVDPRISPIGSFLRRFSLDELPQVWNVITGTMSLVGPRPIVAAEVEKYRDSFQYYCRVKPGLTGLWQVSGRSELTYDERVALDCNYVQHWSLTRDLIILTKTFSAVINQDGAF
jgi:lipopolysaccharide/colanic/teichoic acid biosynthesis glycosyltransferase